MALEGIKVELFRCRGESALADKALEQHCIAIEQIESRGTFRFVPGAMFVSDAWSRTVLYITARERCFFVANPD